MYIYNYNPVTGEFLGASLADENPLQSGQYLIPANATDIEPPVPGKNEMAVFSAGSWSIQPDFRGQVLYNTETGAAVQITVIGAMSGNLTALKPSDNSSWNGSAWVFDSAKALKTIRSKRNALLSACDWTQLPNSPLTTAKVTEWATYRQVLRDFPGNCDPAAPVWPVQPE